MYDVDTPAEPVFAPEPARTRPAKRVNKFPARPKRGPGRPPSKKRFWQDPVITACFSRPDPGSRAQRFEVWCKVPNCPDNATAIQRFWNVFGEPAATYFDGRTGRTLAYQWRVREWQDLKGSRRS